MKSMKMTKMTEFTSFKIHRFAKQTIKQPIKFFVIPLKNNKMNVEQKRQKYPTSASIEYIGSRAQIEY